jgi:hypothetical protein
MRVNRPGESRGSGLAMQNPYETEGECYNLVGPVCLGIPPPKQE